MLDVPRLPKRSAGTIFLPPREVRDDRRRRHSSTSPSPKSPVSGHPSHPSKVSLRGGWKSFLLPSSALASRLPRVEARRAPPAPQTTVRGRVSNGLKRHPSGIEGSLKPPGRTSAEARPIVTMPGWIGANSCEPHPSSTVHPGGQRGGPNFRIGSYLGSAPPSAAPRPSSMAFPALHTVMAVEVSRDRFATGRKARPLHEPPWSR